MEKKVKLRYKSHIEINIPRLRNRANGLKLPFKDFVKGGLLEDQSFEVYEEEAKNLTMSWPQYFEFVETIKEV